MCRRHCFTIFLLIGHQLSGWGQDALTRLKIRFELEYQQRAKLIKTFSRNGFPALDAASLLVDIRNGRPVVREALNANAAQTTGVTLLQGGGLGFDLQGEGMLVGVWDDGLVIDHTELTGRVVATEGILPASHATHVTGTLIAAGLNPAARGMAPRAQAFTAFFDNDLAKMAALSTADQTSLLLSNHSYGEVTGWSKGSGTWVWWGDESISSAEDYRFGFYGDRAHDLDALAFLAPYHTIVWAAGNDRIEAGNGGHLPDCNGGTGYDCIIPDAVAKNIITVGAVDKVLTYSGTSDVKMSNFSSWGPTDDGRIKPDLVADGVNLFSLSASSPTAYGNSSGTSMATPNVTGSLLLVQELSGKLRGGKFLRSSTLKALAIHTAKEAGAFPGPDYSFGWGLLDVAAAARVLRSEDGHNTYLIESELVNGGTFELQLQPKAGQKIVATLVWTDSPAVPVANALDPNDLMLGNDLDLRITDEAGISQFPWRLEPLNPAQKASRGDNFRDNVEKIEFDLPQEKKYNLTITHKGQLAGRSQHFSLVVTHTSAMPGPKTYYWIGDSGSWNDGSHWATSSGGAPVAKTPGPADRVIVDENSFDGSGNDLIFLPQDVTVGTLLWMRNKAAGIDFGGKAITIAERLVVGTDQFLISGNGYFHFAAAASGEVSIRKSDLLNTTMSFEAGGWAVAGNIITDRVEVSGGRVDLTGCTLVANQFNSPGAQLREIDLEGSALTLRQSSTLNSTGLTMMSEGATLTAGGNLSLNWQGIDWSGEVASGDGALTIAGTNHLDKLTVQSQLTLAGSLTVGAFASAAGSQLSFQPGAALTIMGEAQVLGSPVQPIILKGTQQAQINAGNHGKLCFDFVQVNGVDVGTNSVINAGTNSAVVNAKNWQQKKCDEVLFADFESRYACSGGLTHFSDLSTGSPTQWLWNFGDGSASNEQNPRHAYNHEGEFTVSLTVSGNGGSHTFTSPVSVTANSVPVNSIGSNMEVLTSLALADTYQWYKDMEPIAGATGRTYAYEGKEGNYTVATYQGSCNRLSETVTVTGLSTEFSGGVVVYPNPGSGRIRIWSERSEPLLRVACRDAGGQIFFPALSRGELDTADLPDGVYILEIETVKGKVIERIIVQH